MLYKFFNHMAKVSNDDFIRNADHLLAKNANIDTTNMQWVGPTKQIFDSSKFKSTY